MLTKNSEILLNKLIDDYYTSKDNKKLNYNDSPAYIYNLFIGKYNFSFNQFKEIYEYLNKKDYVSR